VIGMRRSLAALLIALLAGAIAPFPDSPASASCVGPELVGKPIVLTHDGDQTVTGRFFHKGCADGGSCRLGCGGDCETDDPATPSENVELRITQLGRSWTLGKVDADDDAGTTWTFDLPAGVQPGTARLLPEGASPVDVRIR
jgi:hypothetical protein